MAEEFVISFIYKLNNSPYARSSYSPAEPMRKLIIRKGGPLILGHARYICATVRAGCDSEGYALVSIRYLCADHRFTDRNAVVERDEERV